MSYDRYRKLPGPDVIKNVREALPYGNGTLSLVVAQVI